MNKHPFDLRVLSEAEYLPPVRHKVLGYWNYGFSPDSELVDQFSICYRNEDDLWVDEMGVEVETPHLFILWEDLQTIIQYRLPFQGMLKQLTSRIHSDNRAKGFWDEERNLGETLLLVVTEIAEGFEDYRKGKEWSDKIPHFSPMEEELADALIRIMDLAGGMGFDIWAAVEAKLAYNKTRPHKHGKKF